MYHSPEICDWLYSESSDSWDKVNVIMDGFHIAKCPSIVSIDCCPDTCQQTVLRPVSKHWLCFLSIMVVCYKRNFKCVKESMFIFMNYNKWLRLADTSVKNEIQIQFPHAHIV